MSACDILKQQLAAVDKELSNTEEVLKRAKTDPSIDAHKAMLASLHGMEKQLKSGLARGGELLPPEVRSQVEIELNEINRDIELLKLNAKHINDAPPSPETKKYRKKVVSVQRSLDNYKRKLRDADITETNKKLLEQRAQLEADLVRTQKEYKIAKDRVEEAKLAANERDAGIKAALRAQRKLLGRLNKQEKQYNSTRDNLLEKRRKLSAQLKEADIPIEKRKKIESIVRKFEEVVDAEEYGKLSQKERAKAISENAFLTSLMAEGIKTLESESDMTAMESLLGVYYINLLSGPSTQAINVVSTMLNIGFGTFADIISNIGQPGYFQLTKELLKGTIDGAVAGKDAFLDTVRNKQTIARNLNKYNIPTGTLQLLLTPTEELRTEKRKGELVSQKRKKQALEVATLGFGKHMSVLLMATDAFMRKTREGQLLALLGARLRARGFKGPDGEFMTAAARYFNNSEEVTETARKQAEVEADSFDVHEGDPVKRQQLVNHRTMQIIEQSLGDEGIRTLETLSMRDIFTGDPHGVIGLFAKGLSKFLGAADLPVPTPKGIVKVPLFKYLMPFVNVPANVANEMINYTPVGWFRGMLDYEIAFDESLTLTERKKASLLDADPNTSFTYQQRTEVAKGMIGTGMMAVLGALADAAFDEEDPWFEIYADLRQLSPERRRSLYDAGIKPWSFKIRLPWMDEPIITQYKESMLAAVLAPLGVWNDARRWDKEYDEKTWVDLTAMSSMAGFQALSDASFLKGMRQLMDSFTGNVVAGKGDFFKVLEDVTKQTGRGFIPGWLRSMTKIPGMTVVDMKESMGAYILGSIPFTADMMNLRPALNIFGTELQIPSEVGSMFTTWAAGDRLFTLLHDDPELKYLAKTGLTVTAFPKHNEIGVSLPGGDDVKMAITDVLKRRKELYGNTGAIKKYAERLAFDKLTDDERYDLVKIAGPKIRAAVAYVRDVAMDYDAKDQQKLLDKLVSEAKVDAKAELLSRYTDFIHIPKEKWETHLNFDMKKLDESVERDIGLRL